MIKRFKSFFTENLLLKLISILFAVVVWLLVVNINNPSQSRNFTTVVDVINENILSEQGRFYTIPEGANTVTFRVTAPRSIIERLTPDDFRAVADMSKLEDDSRIPIDIKAINYTGSITISNRLYYLTVEIGEEMEEKYVISAEINGAPASGFITSEIVVDPNIITIRGPESIVSTIDSVKAYCEITGMNNQVSENVVPVLLDSNGNRIDTTRLSLSQSTVKVTVSFVNVKEVPIALESSAEENENVDIENISISPSTVRIMGDSSILNDITEIQIPASVIDLSTIDSDITTTVDISRYLPAGASLTIDNEPEVKVEIKVTREKTIQLDVPIGNISVRNLAQGKQYKFDSETIQVSIKGLPSTIKEVTGDSLTGRINVDGLSDGEHTVRVEMDEDESYTIGVVTVKITITSQGNNNEPDRIDTTENTEQTTNTEQTIDTNQATTNTEDEL